VRRRARRSVDGVVLARPLWRQAKEDLREESDSRVSFVNWFENEGCWNFENARKREERKVISLA